MIITGQDSKNGAMVVFPGVHTTSMCCLFLQMGPTMGFYMLRGVGHSNAGTCHSKWPPLCMQVA